MKHEVKILLYPEEHKSKNGSLFEKLMRTAFEYQGYVIDQNINFTGLEIDLWGTHMNRNERLLIECKAKQKPLSSEIKNFSYNVNFYDANWGYFLYTEELDHQAAGLVKQMEEMPDKYKNLVFLGPDSIIKTLVRAKFIRDYQGISMLEDSMIYKVIFAYTYFGNYYIFLDLNEAVPKNYYIYDAQTLKEFYNVNSIADIEHNSTQTIDQALKNGIKELQNLKHKTFGVNKVLVHNTVISLDEKFNQSLEDVGAAFLHSKVDELKLSDIFVEPNLKKISSVSTKKKEYKVHKLWKVLDDFEGAPIKLIITGDEVSGKTAICKRIFYRLFNQGMYPILINGEEIKSINKDSFYKDVEKIFYKQYGSALLDSIDRKKIVLIIDDFDKFKHHNKEEFRDVLVKNINIDFQNIILFGGMLMSLELKPKNKNIKDLFYDYTLYDLLEMGPTLRHELVEKWYKLGNDNNFTDKNELFRKYDAAERYIESIIGKNYIPSHPFYILTILQTLDTVGTQNSNYSVHGFYYEHLINQKIYSIVKDKNNISLLYNYVTELAFLFYQLDKKTLTVSEFKDFHDLYCQEYSIESASDSILRDLQNAKIIDFNGSIKLSYNYIYYFFVAKYLANKLSDDSIKAVVSKLCKKVYKEEYGSIIMFLTHLSKDPFIIKELVNNATQLFNDVPIVRFEDDIQNINLLIKEIPPLVIDSVEAEDKRAEELEERDTVERLEKEYEEESFDKPVEDISSISLINKLILAMKTIEILGQMTKNYWGSMNGIDKYLVASETYFLGLRAIKSYLLSIEKDKEDIILHIRSLILKKHVKDQYLREEIEEVTSEFIFKMCFMASYGVIKRISHAIGYEKLSLIFQSILRKNNHNSIKLIDLSIKLDHYQDLPMKDINSLKSDLSNNYLGTLVLRNLVVDYLYMFKVDYKQKQMICNMLGITMQTQRFIDSTSKIKKESN